MWLLQYISENFVHLMVLISAAGLLVMPFLMAIPFFQTYKTAAQYVCIAVLALGIFTEGSLSNNKMWERKTLQQEVKDAEKETKMAESVTTVVEEVKEKIAKVKEKQNVLIVKVPVYITEKADTECTIPNSVVQLYDYSATNRAPGTTDRVQEGSSNVELSEMSKTTIVNNAKYYELKDRYEGLVKLYEEQRRIINEQ